jgi:hypothetical protein
VIRSNWLLSVTFITFFPRLGHSGWIYSVPYYLMGLCLTFLPSPLNSRYPRHILWNSQRPKVNTTLPEYKVHNISRLSCHDLGSDHALSYYTVAHDVPFASNELGILQYTTSGIHVYPWKGPIRTITSWNDRT